MESITAGDADRMWTRISKYLTRTELKNVKSKRDFQNLLKSKLPDQAKRAGQQRAWGKQKNLMVNLLFDIMQMHKKESFARDIKILRKKERFVHGKKIVTTTEEVIRVPFMWRASTTQEAVWFDISQYLTDRQLQSVKDVDGLRDLLYENVPKNYSYGRKLVGKKAVDYALSNLKKIAVPVFPKKVVRTVDGVKKYKRTLFKWNLKSSYIYRVYKRLIEIV